jgi:hypothetical protein
LTVSNVVGFEQRVPPKLRAFAAKSKQGFQRRFLFYVYFAALTFQMASMSGEP